MIKKIDKNSYIVRNPHLIATESEDEFIILNPDTNIIYSLNDTAKEIWVYIEEKKTVNQIIDNLYSILDVKKKILEQDIFDFISKFNTILFQIIKTHP